MRNTQKYNIIYDIEITQAEIIVGAIYVNINFNMAIIYKKMGYMIIIIIIIIIITITIIIIITIS